MSAPQEVMEALHTLYARLATLGSIRDEQILLPGGPQEQYHALIEETYAALGRLETELDACREELEYQHKRLDAARDAALAQKKETL